MTVYATQATVNKTWTVSISSLSMSETAIRWTEAMNSTSLASSNHTWTEPMNSTVEITSNTWTGTMNSTLLSSSKNTSSEAMNSTLLTSSNNTWSEAMNSTLLTSSDNPWTETTNSTLQTAVSSTWSVNSTGAFNESSAENSTWSQNSTSWPAATNGSWLAVNYTIWPAAMQSTLPTAANSTWPSAIRGNSSNCSAVCSAYCSAANSNGSTVTVLEGTNSSPTTTTIFSTSSVAGVEGAGWTTEPATAEQGLVVPQTTAVKILEGLESLGAVEVLAEAAFSPPADRDSSFSVSGPVFGSLVVTVPAGVWPVGAGSLTAAVFNLPPGLPVIAGAQLAGGVAVNFGPEGFTFARPIGIEVPFNRSGQYDGLALGVYKYDVTTKVCNGPFIVRSTLMRDAAQAETC